MTSRPQRCIIVPGTTNLNSRKAQYVRNITHNGKHRAAARAVRRLRLQCEHHTESVRRDDIQPWQRREDNRRGRERRKFRETLHRSALEDVLQGRPDKRPERAVRHLPGQRRRGIPGGHHLVRLRVRELRGQADTSQDPRSEEVLRDDTQEHDNLSA